MVHGGKLGYFLTYQASSPRLSQGVLSTAGIIVDEIVGTRDISGSCLYAYIHLSSKMTEEVLKGKIMSLSNSHGIRETNIFGYDAVASSSTSTSDLIEDHPGFKILVQHQTQGNEHFHRWTAEGYADANSGYNKLKAKLISKRTTRVVIPPVIERSTFAGRGMTGEGSSSGGVSNMGVEDVLGSSNGAQPSGLHDRNKRPRQWSPLSSGGSGMCLDASAVDFVRTIMEDASRKHDAVTQLREKVAILESEKKLSVLEVRAAEHANQLAIKDAEIGRLVGDKTSAEREASEQRRIAEEAATKQREAEQLKSDVEARLTAKDAELGTKTKEFEESLATKDAELETKTKEFEALLATRDSELGTKTKEFEESLATKDAELETMTKTLEEHVQRIRALEAEVAQLRQGSCVGAGGGVQSPGDEQVLPENEARAGEGVNSPREEQSEREEEASVGEEPQHGNGESLASDEQYAVVDPLMQVCRWIVRYIGTAHIKCGSLLTPDGAEGADECISMENRGVYTAFFHLKERARVKAVKSMLSKAAEITEFKLLELGRRGGRGRYYMKVIQARLATNPGSLHINITRQSVGRQSTRFSAERGSREYKRKAPRAGGL